MAMLPNPLPQLATDPSGRSLGLQLPPGRLIDATIDGPWHEPLLWCADEPARPGDWSALLPARKAAGLHPVLIGSGGSAHKQQPDAWDLAPAMMSYPGDHDAEEVLEDFWEEYAADELADPEDHPDDSAWPGLAPATAPDLAPDDVAADIADALSAEDSWLSRPRLALVPARRSADIPAALGWTGPLNHENDVARLCSVLRSWEDRFGIRVVALTFDQLVVSVAGPPTTPDEAEAVAAEHFAFCPDNITQGSYADLREYAAKAVLDQPAWSFWWD
ncbi:DUF4253 domain-containing protein [Streptomyces formicae]|uniref:DUF4253 domain-containing protein n=1 Tax=Streptomyces formicae TaxID=1616117 RepID=A0ABY3WDH0_9ACTN|nr:DUF4253 domain-containing protein [Streptomyces formicae]UNM10607.1 DUF4253 domain-containing protein [Streptomyces formicae]